MSTRRNFFEDILVAASLAGMLENAAEAQPARSDSASVSSIDFWGRFFDQAIAESQGTRSVSSHVRPLLAAQHRDVRYLYHDGSRFHYAGEIPQDKLLDHLGDVAVTISLGQFRPGNKDQRNFQKLQVSQFRLDCAQAKPLANLFAPLAWTAMASLFPDKAGKLPSLQQLGFQSADQTGASNKVVLPSGMGKLAVNVSMLRAESLLHKMLTGAVKLGGIVSPFMSLPAMSLPALKAFTDLYSKLEQQTTFLLNSTLTPAIASKQALTDADRAVTYIPLISGDYILVPQEHVGILGDHLDKLDFTQGYLIDKGASKNIPLEDRAKSSVQDVTYVTMRLAVSPISGPINAAPKTGSDPGGAQDAASVGRGGLGSNQKTGSNPNSKSSQSTKQGGGR
jgi:hypothetical protein